MKIKLLALSLILASGGAWATAPEFTINIKDHQFAPANTNIPANTKVKLIVVNSDPTPEEFESHDLHREKIIKGNGKTAIMVGPLKAGVYKFVGEYNEDSAQGTITVK